MKTKEFKYKLLEIVGEMTGLEVEMAQAHYYGDNLKEKVPQWVIAYGKLSSRLDKLAKSLK